MSHPKSPPTELLAPATAQRVPRETVERMASLASLALSDSETDALSRDLSQILDYVAQLEAVDVTDVVPMAHPQPWQPGAQSTERKLPLRRDAPAASLPRDVALASAPGRNAASGALDGADGFVVPAFVDEG